MGDGELPYNTTLIAERALSQSHFGGGLKESECHLHKQLKRQRLLVVGLRRIVTGIYAPRCDPPPQAHGFFVQHLKSGSVGY